MNRDDGFSRNRRRVVSHQVYFSVQRSNTAQRPLAERTRSDNTRFSETFKTSQSIHSHECRMVYKCRIVLTNAAIMRRLTPCFPRCEKLIVFRVQGFPGVASLYIYIYLYTYIYMYIYIYIYIYIHIHTCIYMFMNVYVCIYAYM